MPRSISLFALFLLAVPPVQGQDQTIRGTVVDLETRVPLIGANVVVVGSRPLLGAATDLDGRFSISGVPLGRHSILIRYVGYESRELPNTLVRAGHETVLDVGLMEAVLASKEVVVQASSKGGRASDDVGAVSVRSLTVAKAERLAGAMDDPARLAATLPGVATAGTGVQDNAVAIRGNAPKGTRWYLEGIPIPTPSHFAELSVAGGGGLTLFSGRLLADSDVYTGAFPAQYGNALAGVFDMHFRTGNSARRQHALQLGLIGLEIASEGPIRPGTKATYLVNYRYSTLGLIMPLLPTEGHIGYQDLAFKLALPTSGLGRFEVWGLGGLDRQTGPEEPDSSAWIYDDWDRTRFDLDLAIGAAGITHHAVLGTRTYVRTSLAGTRQRTAVDERRLDDSLVLRPEISLTSLDGRAIFSSVLTHKSDSRHLNRSGLTIQRLFYDLDIRGAPDHRPPLIPIAVGNGRSFLLQAFSQSRFRVSGRLEFNVGVHAQHLAQTGATAVEPRIGIAMNVGSGRQLTLGYGLHSQAEDLRIYLVQLSDGSRPNQTLGFTRAHHLAMGYRTALGSSAELHVEGYYQRLFDVPIGADSWSMLNFTQDWTFAEALDNTGAGQNYGLEVLLERALHSGFYATASVSVYDSQFRDRSGQWHPTRFDQGYTANVLAGREFEVGESNLLSINVRLASGGGQRRSPIDQLQSQRDGTVVLDESRPFSVQMPDLWLMDLNLSLRLNGRGRSRVIALQLKNALAAKDSRVDYNYRDQRAELVREGYPLPVLRYTLEW